MVARSSLTIVLRYQHANDATKDKEAEAKEDTDKPLGVVTEIDTIVFLVTLVDLPALIGKHSIDFLQVFLHLGLYLLVVFVKRLLHLLPVCMRNFGESYAMPNSSISNISVE